MANPKRKKSALYEWVESILVALVLAIFIRTYFIQPFKIPSGSMRMTLIEGDHLFVSKLRYGPILLPEIHSPDFIRNTIDIQWPEFLKPLSKVRLPGFGKLERGDVIVFVYPEDRTKDFIKRLIALPGDTVEIKDGKAYVNGEVMKDERNKNFYYYNRGDFGAENDPIKVPQGKYFVMGDNSGSSHDSRYWGFVDQNDIVGRAEVIFWPLTRIRVIQ